MLKFMDYEMFEILRIFPLSEKEFSDKDNVKDYFKHTIKEQEGKFYYRKRTINADKGTLVLFQYHGNIVAHAKLLEVSKYKSPIIEDEVKYNGHFLFDLDTVRYYREPLSQEEFYKIYTDKPLTRVTHILDNQVKNDQLIKLIDSRI